MERPHQYKQEKWLLPTFDAALTWAESELRTAAEAAVLPPPPAPLSLATLTPAQPWLYPHTFNIIREGAVHYLFSLLYLTSIVLL
jgi:hypothetical protein